MSRWLTPEEVDAIIDNASADDIIEAVALYPDMRAHVLEASREIFNRSAERLEGMTNGATASQMIHARDFSEWADKIGSLMSADGPLPDTEASPDSADTGE